MDLFGDDIVVRAKALFAELTGMDDDARMDVINELRMALHAYSPMNTEPVDCVLWVPADKVGANDYNPNRVAPPEMQLLARSIIEDGYTQPIVAWQDGDAIEVVDGYHRSRCGKENKEIRQRVKGRLPVAFIKQTKQGRPDRMAATIRHNRARGEHDIGMMKDIVADLVQSGMSDQWVMKHVGMDADELLRLKQITGLAALFKDSAFSRAWVKSEADAPFYEGQGQ